MQCQIPRSAAAARKIGRPNRLISAAALRIGWRRGIAAHDLVQSIRTDSDFHTGTLLRQQHDRAGVALRPAPIHGFGNVCKRQVCEPHRHTELTGEASRKHHVLVDDPERRIRRLEF